MDRFHNFTVLLAGIQREIYRIKSGEMAEFCLKASHVSCLYYLYKEALTAKELCLLCGEDKANISRAIKRLEERGYLRDKKNCAKRNQSVLELTETGREIGRKIAEKVDEFLARASVGIDEKEREIMYGALKKIQENLNQESKTYRGQENDKDND